MKDPDKLPELSFSMAQPGTQPLLEVAGRRMQGTAQGLAVVLEHIAVLLPDSSRHIDHVDPCPRRQIQRDFSQLPRHLALRRELREELGVEVENIRPAFFKDCLHEKTFADGTRRPVYMIFLLFHCTAVVDELRLNDEFVEYRWLREREVGQLDLNEETLDTLARLGSWSDTL